MSEKRLLSWEYPVGSFDNRWYFSFDLKAIPVWAISSPLSGAWDKILCPVCDDEFYQLGLDGHLKTHVYKRPLWIRFLRWMMS